MLLPVLLICAVSVLPQFCTRETAIDVVVGAKQDNLFMCGRMGQAQLASTVLGPAKGQYVKITCERIV